jgi:hypothetical protein
VLVVKDTDDLLGDGDRLERWHKESPDSGIGPLHAREHGCHDVPREDDAGPDFRCVVAEKDGSYRKDADKQQNYVPLVELIPETLMKIEEGSL